MDYRHQDEARSDSCLYCGAWWEDPHFEECPMMSPPIELLALSSDDSNYYNWFMGKYFAEMREFDPTNTIAAAASFAIWHSGVEFIGHVEERDYTGILAEAKSFKRLGFSLEDILIWVEGGAK